MLLLLNSASTVLLVPILVLLVAAVLFWLLPGAARRGLLFGVHVGTRRTDDPAVTGLLTTWRVSIGVLTLAAVAAWLLVGPKNALAITAAEAVLLLGVGVLYLVLHSRARRLAVPMATADEDAAEPTTSGEVPPEELPARWLMPYVLVALGLSLLLGLMALGHAMAVEPKLPERIPTHFGTSGEPDAWSDKSFAAVYLLSCTCLGMALMLGGFALLTAQVQGPRRLGDDGRSYRARRGFQASVALMLANMSVMVSAMLAYFSWAGLRTALGEMQGLGAVPLIALAVILPYSMGHALWLIVKHGQGGAAKEGAAGDQPLVGGVADNEHWKLGVIYYNPEDPELMVEKRFGVGYTFNFAHGGAIALMLGMVVFFVGVLVAAFTM
ncbi:MAG: DUF5808 domain-containing protein [Acidobacteriota bacterium]